MRCDPEHRICVDITFSVFMVSKNRWPTTDVGFNSHILCKSKCQTIVAEEQFKLWHFQLLHVEAGGSFGMLCWAVSVMALNKYIKIRKLWIISVCASVVGSKEAEVKWDGEGLNTQKSSLEIKLKSNYTHTHTVNPCRQRSKKSPKGALTQLCLCHSWRFVNKRNERGKKRLDFPLLTQVTNVFMNWICGIYLFICQSLSGEIIWTFKIK